MSCAYLLLLRTLRAVLRTALLTVLDALGIKDTAQHVITHAGKVAHISPTDQHNTVFLQVMAFAGHIADDFSLLGQIGRESCRETDCPSGYMSGVDDSVK